MLFKAIITVYYENHMKLGSSSAFRKKGETPILLDLIDWATPDVSTDGTGKFSRAGTHQKQA
jgi:hypothetical protein